MDRGKSSLNPDAASYIPTEKQEATDKNKYFELTTEGSLKSDDENAWSFSPTESHCKSGKYLQADSSDSGVHDIERHSIDNEVTRKGHDNSTDHTGAEYFNEGSEVDLDYLAFLFPDVSENSLANVYSVNGGDVEESIDMLKQLQSPLFSVPKRLPESANTDDYLEGKVIAEDSSLKPETFHSREVVASSRDSGV